MSVFTTTLDIPTFNIVRMDTEFACIDESYQNLKNQMYEHVLIFYSTKWMLNLNLPSEVVG